MQNGIFAPPSGGFTGATPHRDGQPGPVPAPKAGQQNMFLSADGRFRLPDYAGGAGSSAMPTDIDLTASSPRVLTLSPTVAGRFVTLPNAVTMPALGGPLFLLNNIGAHTIQIRTFAGGALGEIQPGQIATISLAAQNSPQGTWVVGVQTRWTGTSFSAPLGLLPTNTSNTNLKLSATSTPNKYLLSYTDGSGLAAILISVEGRTISAGPPVTLVPNVSSAQAALLDDANGLSVIWDYSARQMKVQGFTVNLSTGAITPVGLMVNLGTQTGTAVYHVKVSRVTNQVALVSWLDHTNKVARCALVRFDGGGCAVGPVLDAMTSSADVYDLYNAVLSPTKAHLVWYCSDSLITRGLTLDVSTLGVAVDTSYSLGTRDVYYLTPLDQNRSVATASGWGIGIFTGNSMTWRPWPASNTNPGEPILWNPQSGTAIYTVNESSVYNTYAVDFSIAADNTITLQTATQRLLLTGTSGPHEYGRTTVGRNGTEALFIYRSTQAPYHLTAIKVEKV
jgi:hypothetical protein